MHTHTHIQTSAFYALRSKSGHVWAGCVALLEICSLIYMGHILFSDSSFSPNLSETLFLPRLRQAPAWMIDCDTKMASFFQSRANVEMKNEMKTARSRELPEDIEKKKMGGCEQMAKCRERYGKTK